MMATLSITTYACEISTFQLKSTSPINGEKFVLDIAAYDAGSEKQVVIYPPFGGSTTLEKKYAAKICARGMSAYILVKWTGYDETSVTDLSVHERGTINGLHAFETFYNHSPKETQLLGTSLGGIYAGIAIGKYDYVKKAVVIASGTNLAGILATSSLPELRSLKKKRFEHFGFTSDQEYIVALNNHLLTKALNYQANLWDKKLLIFKTNRDGVIKPKFQRELIDLFDRKNSYIYSTRFGHKKGIVWTYVRRKNRITSFLSSKDFKE